jgi:predicted Zn-dependent protease
MASIIRFPVRDYYDPPGDGGTYLLEQEMAELSDAAEDAEAYANEYEAEGDYAKADEWLAKRDAFSARYHELRRRCDDITGGW